MSETLQIPLIAGYNDDDEPIAEKVQVTEVEGVQNEFRLALSPVFVRGVAAGDRIRYPADTTSGYELLEHSGNLGIRVFSKHDITEVGQVVTPALELIDGKLDVQSPGILVYSIHVSIGFKRIEDVLTQALATFPNSIWYYGNVYDPEDGTTPLNWWLEISEEV